MDPITATVTVDRPREELFALLADLRAHERFTDHFLVDYSGDADRIRARAKLPGPKQWSEVTWAEPPRPDRLVERLTAAGGRREMRSEWRLDEAGPERTAVTFSARYVRATTSDRLLAPLTTGWLRKANQKALDRLKALAEAGAAPAAA